VSQSPYDCLNLGEHVGDDMGSVAANRLILGTFLPADPIWLTQTHGTTVFDADKWVPYGPSGYTEPPQADAAITTLPNYLLCIMTADCLPVLLASKDGQVIGAAHAGWRGLSLGVIEATVAAMRQKVKKDDLEIQAYFGAAIGPEAFEVGEEVRTVFIEHDPQCSDAFKPCAAAGKYMADLYQLARLRLQALGITSIEGGEDCTFKDQRFFSYRRDGHTGRMANLIWKTGS
jgi:YfiH family protein